MPNPWPDCAGIPPAPRAILAALHLADPRPDLLARLTDSEWQDALYFSDRARVTLILRDIARAALPPAIRDRVDENASHYALRLQRTEAEYRAVDDVFRARGLEYLAVKGLAHTAVPGRVQYDIDLYLPGETVREAHAALIAAGWSPLKGMDRFPTDHLPALLRQTEWTFTGDLFDPALPISVELHFQFWNERIERLRAPGVDEFWNRRVTRPIAGLELQTLSPPDALGYASLHLLKHVLRGSAGASHVYEIARMLAAGTPDLSLHSPELRRLEAVIFRLAHEWFGGPIVDSDLLPHSADVWFRDFALSPATQAFHPNKDHLWLHIALLDSPLDALRVARRRLLPATLPARGGEPSRAWRHRILHRVRHHAIAFPKTVVSGLHFWWRVNALGRQFWLFLASAAMFNFPLFIFVLLYNLFLLDLGFHEDFIGTVNSAMRIGSMAGTIPAAVIAHKLGLRRSLILTILATAAAEVLRALIGARFPLAALAFLSGCVFAVWAVIMAPLIAGAVGERRRATAFSVFFACMFATGIVGNWIGGLLPTLLSSRRAVLLAAAALSALAAIPALRLAEFARPPAGARIYPRNRFLLLYLIPFAIWHLATGTFNPFNNVYFKRLGFPDRRIGSVFALSQLVQVGALLTAPAIIRRLGLLNGIVVMMAATAFGLAALAAQPTATAAVTAYIAYMSFQWMSEPGLNTLLMNRIPDREHSGASALNYVVAFGAQAISAWLGGLLFNRLGYAPALLGAAALAATAALLFKSLLPKMGSA